MAVNTFTNNPKLDLGKKCVHILNTPPTANIGVSRVTDEPTSPTRTKNGGRDDTGAAVGAAVDVVVPHLLDTSNFTWFVTVAVAILVLERVSGL